MFLPRVRTRGIGTWQRPSRVRRNGLQEEESGRDLIGRCQGHFHRNERWSKVGRGGCSRIVGLKAGVDLEGERKKTQQK